MEFQEDAIFQPVIVLIIWTLIVMVWMFVGRIGAFNRQSIPPSQLKHTSEVDSSLPTQVRALGDNFKNLAELPVVFYALALAIYAAGHVDPWHIYCAWGFVGFRIVHSLIHGTYNNVMHRFGIYLISAAFLIVMAVREAEQLFIS